MLSVVIVSPVAFTMSPVEHAGAESSFLLVQRWLRMVLDTYFTDSSKEEPSRKHCDVNIEWYNFQGQAEVT